MSECVRRLLDLPRPTAWVFTAGGARVAAQVGIAEVLLEQGLRPELFVGSSLGAINAAGFCDLIDPDSAPDTSTLREVWRRIGEESLLANPGAAAVRGFAPRTGRSAKEFRAILATQIRGDGPLPEQLILVTSDLETGRSRILARGAVLEAVLASCALPVLFSPVRINDRLYVDGGLTAAAPIEQALTSGAKSIIMLDTGASAEPEEAVKEMRWWQIAALSYNHQIRGQLSHSLARVAGKIPVVTVSTDAGDQLDFTQPEDLFQAGRRDAAAALAGGLGDGPFIDPGVYGVPIGLAGSST